MVSVLGPPPGGAAHAIVPDVEQPELDAADDHHLRRVLRLRAGQRLSVTDGAGHWRWCRYGSALEIDGPVEAVATPAPVLTVACAWTKGAKPEIVVQKLTEVGVDRIVFFPAARSERQRDAGYLDRLRRIAREASMQCRRAWLPEVAVLTDPGELFAGGAARADFGGSALSVAHSTVVVGPEGGWDPTDTAFRLPAVTLGPLVLRAETAAITAGVLLVTMRTANGRDPDNFVKKSQQTHVE